MFGDHLGSTSVVANYDGSLYARQGYYAWGEQRFPAGASPLPTTFRYTGQRESASLGLYFYGARWYDPALGRFIQPDTIVPGVGEDGNPNAIGYMDDVTYSPLTVDYHEDQFLAQLNYENSQRFQDPNFHLPPVPTNSIAFDRYAYSLNNPLRYVDPNGHDAGLAELLVAAVAALVAAPVEVVVAVAVVCLVAAAALVVAAIGPENVANAVVNLADDASEAVSGAADSESKSSSTSKGHTPDQEALVDLAKEAKNKGGVSEQDAQTLMDWAKQTDLKGSSEHVEQHPGRNFKRPHIRIGPINHIPVLPPEIPPLPKLGR
jgi:RHS repeat-associated protein